MKSVAFVEHCILFFIFSEVFESSEAHQGKETDKQTARQTETDRQRETQIERDAERQTESDIQIHTHADRKRKIYTKGRTDRLSSKVRN